MRSTASAGMASLLHPIISCQNAISDRNRVSFMWLPAVLLPGCSARVVSYSAIAGFLLV